MPCAVVVATAGVFPWSRSSATPTLASPRCSIGSRAAKSRCRTRCSPHSTPPRAAFRLPEEREIILTDTVGFIHDLPKTLVEAFKATLEELEEADLLLHVLDASDPEVEHQKADVDGILDDLELHDRPTLLIWNKADRTDPARLRELLTDHGGLACSALTGEGTHELLDRVEQELFRSGSRVESAAAERHTA